MLLVTLGVGLLLGPELDCGQVRAFSRLHSANLVNVRVVRDVPIAHVISSVVSGTFVVYAQSLREIGRTRLPPEMLLSSL